MGTCMLRQILIYSCLKWRYPEFIFRSNIKTSTPNLRHSENSQKMAIYASNLPLLSSMRNLKFWERFWNQKKPLTWALALFICIKNFSISWFIVHWSGWILNLSAIGGNRSFWVFHWNLKPFPIYGFNRRWSDFMIFISKLFIEFWRIYNRLTQAWNRFVTRKSER